MREKGISTALKYEHEERNRGSQPAIDTLQRLRGVSSAQGTARKGETYELRAGLVSQYAWERKESIQKTIMSMTLGKDVSALFPDVLKNIATPDLDQKKLVYLYLMNYAK